MIELFIKLMFAMAVTDIALQSDWLAFTKTRINPPVVQGVVGLPEIAWYYAMGAHSMINGAGVWLVTGNVWFGVAETALHFIADVLKVKGVIGQHLDVIFHVICRVFYAVAYFWLIK